MDSKTNNQWDDWIGFKQEVPEEIQKIMGPKPGSNVNSSLAKSFSKKITSTDTSRSSFITTNKPINPPFLGTKVISSSDIQLEDIVFYLDKNALFSK